MLDAVLLRYAAEAEGHKTFIDWVDTGYDPDTITRQFKSSGLAGFLHDRVLRRE